MGLDMYLKAERYVGGWNHSEPGEKETFNKLLKALGAVSCPDAPGMEISLNCVYWRKANAIHAWFVRECAAGVDECQNIEVSREQLNKLVETCKMAVEAFKKKDKEAVMKLLPPQSGFFFGSTDIDQYYRHDLEHTIHAVQDALAQYRKDWSFVYRASW